MPMSEKLQYNWLSSFTSDYFNDVIYLFHSTCRTMLLGAKYGKMSRNCALIIFQTLQTNQLDSLLGQLWPYKWNTWQQSQNPRRIPTTISVITLILTNKQQPVVVSTIECPTAYIIWLIILFFFRLLISEVATAVHLSPSHCIPNILLCHTNTMQVLLHYINESSLWCSSFPAAWQLLCPIYQLSFLCTCQSHLSLTSLTLSPNHLTCLTWLPFIKIHIL